MKRFLPAVVALVFVVACSKVDGPKGEYVVKIDGTTITKEEVQAEMNNLPEMARDMFGGPEGMTRFVDELVKKEMLYLEAKKKGLDKNKELEKKIEDFRKITLINQLLEKEIEAAAKVTDADLKNYYDKNKDEFTANTQVRVSQIVVRTEADAKKVYEKIQKGEDFAKIASATSIDKASAKSGGDMGNFKRGDMAPELENVAFRLKKGELGMPVQMKDGIHIMKATETKGAPVEFERVKSLLSQKLTVEKQRESFDKFLENLKKSYKVEINKDAIAKITAAAPKKQEQATEQKKTQK